MSVRNDKIELLKLKQGIIEESESIKEEKPPEKYEVHGLARITNFFYHNKVYILAVSFVIIAAVIMIVPSVTKEKEDIRVLIAVNDKNVMSSLYLKIEDLEKSFEKFTPDYDKSGYVHDEIYYIDMSESSDPQFVMANQSKFYGELATGKAVMLIANMEMFEEMLADEPPENLFTDLHALFPECENITGNYYFKIKGSPLADEAGYETACPDDLYIALRSDFQGLASKPENLSNEGKYAVEVLSNIISGNIINSSGEEKER